MTRDYLLYSVSLHFAAALAAIALFHGADLKHNRPADNYYIDFIGNRGPAVTSGVPAAHGGIKNEKPAEKEIKTARLKKDDTKKTAPAGLKKEIKDLKPSETKISSDTKIKQPERKKISLAEYLESEDFAGGLPPAPSMLSKKTPSGAENGAETAEAENKDDRAGAAENQPQGGSLPTVDGNNFPYPWYLEQIRGLLWDSWTSKMPSAGQMNCTVRFTILRNGSAKNIKIEKSSGNRLFDTAAQSSVSAAAPFKPLPAEYGENTLTVHVEFRTVN